MKKQSFLYGATVLAVASILCKIMSAVFKIPLDRFFLHEEGIAIYQSAYSVYNVFLAVCVTGIPIALSSLVAKSNEKEAAELTKSTLSFVTVLMTVCGVLLILFSLPLSQLMSGGTEGAAQPSLIILALSFPALGVISARRGYFQGMGNMTPSAVSQLVESFIKVVLGILVCAFTVKYGITVGAAGAICGVSAGALFSCLTLELFYRKSKPLKVKPSLKQAIRVIKISVPMTLGAFGFTAVMLTDSLTVTKILAFLGENFETRLSLFGYLTRANTVYNLPATIITAFTASAVPSVAQAFSKGDSDGQSESAKKVIRLVFLIAIPCMLGMVLFAKEILLLLYGSEKNSHLLMLAGIMALIMPYIQTTTAMLQTLGKVWLPIYVSMGAVIVKAALNVVFIKSFGVAGAMIATICAFSVVFIFNTLLLNKTVKLKGVLKPVVKIIICAVISCFGARLLYNLIGTTLMLPVSIMVAGIVYVLGIFFTGCIKKEEFFSK